MVNDINELHHTTWLRLISVLSVWASAVVGGTCVFSPFVLLKVVCILALYGRLVDETY